MVRHSKLQKQVLSLYRQFLRAAQDKPGFIPRIRDEFHSNAAIKKTDVMHIEYLYRRGQRQLELLKDVNTKQFGTFSKSKEDSWPLSYIIITVFKYLTECVLQRTKAYKYILFSGKSPPWFQLFKWKDETNEIFSLLRITCNIRCFRSLKLDKTNPFKFCLLFMHINWQNHIFCCYISTLIF